MTLPQQSPIIPNIRKKSTIATGIHIGANTHHHDQLITPQSLSTTKATVSSVPRPTPEPPALTFTLSIFSSLFLVEISAPSGARTLDLLIKSQ